MGERIIIYISNNNKIYNMSGGLHGVGLSVVNALSENLEVKVFKKGNVYTQKYKKGIVKTKLIITLFEHIEHWLSSLWRAILK